MNEGILNMPKLQALKAYNLINAQVEHNLPLNLSLIFEKYVNKFVTGYLKDQHWKEGKQSEIKRQIYLISRRRIDALKELEKLRGSKIKITFREGGRKSTKSVEEVISPVVNLLYECDLDNAIDRIADIIRKIEDSNIKNTLSNVLKTLLTTRLGVPLNVSSMRLYNIFLKRFNSLINTLENEGFAIECETLDLSWRLAINLGAASVYETSLLFHRNYSIPYIPGSAIKGVTRHWAIQKFAKEVQKLKSVSYEKAVKEVEMTLENGRDLGIELDGIKFKELTDIFGTQNQKGKVIFFDALPVLNDENKDFIVLDVMNVHYRDYYQDESGKTPPGDWMNPNPVFFLAVEGIKFKFVVASKDSNLAERAMELLKEAVKKIGIGAKTSAGYGYFE